MCEAWCHSLVVVGMTRAEGEIEEVEKEEERMAEEVTAAKPALGAGAFAVAGASAVALGAAVGRYTADTAGLHVAGRLLQPREAAKELVAAARKAATSDRCVQRYTLQGLEKAVLPAFLY